jgi:hypothetical protein
MVGYCWDIEERVEDALVAHIKALVTDVTMVIPARAAETVAFPLVLVEAQTSENASDTGRFNGARKINVHIGIITEALNLNGEEGTIEALRTAREQHRIIKSSVIGALAGNTVHEDLNDRQPEGVQFSLAHWEGLSRDAGDGKIITMLAMNITASPKEI